MHTATVEAMPAEISTAVVVAVEKAKVAVATVASSVAPPQPVTKTMPTPTVEATLAEKGARHTRYDPRACRCRRLCRQSA
jgi:hypothetical protein